MPTKIENKQEIEGDINALYELQHSEVADDLIRHHRFVREYYEPYNSNRETNHNFVRGLHYDPDELRKYKDKRKTPVVFNNIKTSERTILGLWLQNRYDVKFSASTPDNDNLAEVLEQLDIWTADQQNDDMNDLEIVRQAWAGGNSFQECYMEVVEGKESTMFTDNQNPFAIYWDPESRKLITREDAKFVDRDSWVSYIDLKKRFSQHKKEIRSQLASERAGDESYQHVQVHADRDHEREVERNGEFLVTERFYLVPGKQYFFTAEGMRIDVNKEDVKRVKKEMPGVQLQTEEVDELWLAIVCQEFSSTEYLYNGPYHCQPRDPRTKKIIWPILEMVAESLAGEPQGFVDHERGPNKIVNAMMSNILSSATHSAAASMLIDPTAFISDREAKLAARHHSDSDRSFQVKPGRVKEAMAPVPRQGVNTDHQYALDYSLSFLREVTSTPPSLQGQEENASTPAALNAQRIEQGFNQLQPLMKNYKAFIKQRAKLRYYYWREYWTAERTFRVLDKTKPEMGEFITINKMEPEADALGRWTGAIIKKNDINAAIYDIRLEESVKSPTYRDKQLSFIRGLAETAFVKNDIGLAAALLEESLRLSDAPKETKDFIKRYSTLLQQAEMQKKQMEAQQGQLNAEGTELDNLGKAQVIADNEAMQTGISPAGQPSGQPARPAPARSAA